MDRRHPGAAHLAQQSVGALGPLLGAARQLGSDPLAQLGRRLVGEGDRQDRVERDPLVAGQPAVAVDHDAGLAGPGAGLDHRHPGPDGDRRGLLCGRAIARSPFLRLAILVVDRRPVAAADRGEVAVGGADVVIAQALARSGVAADLDPPASSRRSLRPASGPARSGPRSPRGRGRRFSPPRVRAGPPRLRAGARAGAGWWSRAAGGRAPRSAPRPRARGRPACRAAAAASPPPRASSPPAPCSPPCSRGPGRARRGRGRPGRSLRAGASRRSRAPASPPPRRLRIGPRAGTARSSPDRAALLRRGSAGAAARPRCGSPARPGCHRAARRPAPRSARGRAAPSGAAMRASEPGRPGARRRGARARRASALPGRSGPESGRAVAGRARGR